MACSLRDSCYFCRLLIVALMLFKVPSFYFFGNVSSSFPISLNKTSFLFRSLSLSAIRLIFLDVLRVDSSPFWPLHPPNSIFEGNDAVSCIWLELFDSKHLLRWLWANEWLKFGREKTLLYSSAISDPWSIFRLKGTFALWWILCWLDSCWLIELPAWRLELDSWSTFHFLMISIIQDQA